MGKIKVVVLGAGSANFGAGIITDLVSSEELREFHLDIVLVDINKPALDNMLKLGNLIKDYYKSKANITANIERTEVLKDADYIIASVAKNRWDLWEKDYYIPTSFGFKHVFGENGGPGGAHAGLT